MKTLFILLLLLLAGFAHRPAGAASYVVGENPGSDSVFFRSTASLEFIEGKTGSLTGWIDWDPAAPQGSATGILQVDLRTLKTGIETRDEHMRDRHLHTEKYPMAWFQLTDLSKMPETVIEDSTYHAVAQGFFYIHGVRRRLKAPIEFAMQGADPELSATVTFELKLDEFRIDRPRALFLKLAETIEVEAVLSARPSASRPLITLPDWEELK